ncbi:MAG: ABC transporter permease, partial [Ignavibacteriaceae bacterium]|nr:ABC transporter permease [Ignavibacteriaceae bacterium]
MIPIKYSIRNFATRKLTMGVTVAGIALVVFVFAAVLMMAYGIKKTLAETGSPDNIKVVRKASNGEISSIVTSDVANIILTLPYPKKNGQGKPIASLEPVVIINLDKKEGGLSNITVRGVSPEVKELRPQVVITEGRYYEPGSRELIVGRSINERFANTNIGDKIKFAGDFWTVVGIYDTDGSGFDSEIWGDGLQMLDAFNRPAAYSSITFKVEDASVLPTIKSVFENDKRLNQFEVKIESEYYAEQSEGLAMFIQILGVFITVVFSLGSIIGAAITMYASVANRTVEIGTLRALGFKRRSVLTAFLIESLFIAFVGGMIGIALASTLQFFSIST